MARKRSARPAAKKAAKKTAARKARKTVGRKVAKPVKRKVAKAVKRKVVTVAKKAAKPVKRSEPARQRAKPAKSAASRTRAALNRLAAKAKQAAPKDRAATVIKKVVVTARAIKAGVTAALTPPRARTGARAKKPNLDRPRKTVADIHGIPSSLGMAGVASAAHSGREELKNTLRKNTSASPALTAGDVDADWQSAETVGDEAPGGDNPTPDQDVVDDIGRALGVEYEDDEELQGGAEIAERDAHRWELDPNSKDDFDDKD